MEDSILISIKKMLGIPEDYPAFDVDITMLINSAMMTLQQLGVGPVYGLIVKDTSTMWSDLIPEGVMLEGVKSYVYLCVKMVFDPPASSYVMDAMKQQKEELEWRLREQAEFYPGDGSTLGYWQKASAQEVADDNEAEYSSGVRIIRLVSNEVAEDEGG